MQEVQAAFDTYVAKCADMRFVLDERVGFDLLHLHWRNMSQDDLAAHADFVVTQIMTSGSDAARRVLFEQMLQILDPDVTAIVRCNASAIANCARVTKVMQKPEAWTRLQERILAGGVVISSEP